MRSNHAFCYLVVLATTMSLFVAGCGSNGATPSPAPTPTKDITITATAPAIAQLGVNSPNYKVAVTVTGSSDTSFTCKVQDVNLGTVDSATCAYVPSATNSGTLKIDVTPTADASKKTTVSIEVRQWMLLRGLNGLQFFDADGKALPITIFTHAEVVDPANGCEKVSAQHDLLKFVCVNLWSDGPNVLNVYKTDGTAKGTSLVGSPISLASQGDQVSFPSFSPDGAKILFISLRTGPNNRVLQGLWTMNLDGTGKVDLYEEAPSNIVAMFPHFTSDGKSITFPNVADGTLWTMGADGTNPHQLLTVTSFAGLYSSDMKTLYYWSADGIHVNGIAEPLYPGNEILMGISPDDKTLLMNGGGKLYVGSVNGGTLTFISDGDWGSF